jgi:hypothetical protein
VKTIQKLALCLCLLGVLSLPLAGCSGTWDGVKHDWHDMTSSNDDGSASTETTAAAQPAPAAQPAQQAQAVTSTQTTTTTTYNR